MEVIRNKRGQGVVLGLIGIIIFSLILMIILGIGSFSMGLVDDQFSQLNFTIGNISFAEEYQNTLQPAIISLETTVPQIISVSVLFGMVILLLIVGYNAKKIDQLWILLDIFIIISAEVIAVAVRSSFVSFMNNTIPGLLTIYSTTLSGGARFILNLPTIVPTLGVLVMIATYFINEKKEAPEEF